jgi:hypothetical protein
VFIKYFVGVFLKPGSTWQFQIYCFVFAILWAASGLAGKMFADKLAVAACGYAIQSQVEGHENRGRELEADPVEDRRGQPPKQGQASQTRSIVNGVLGPLAGNSRVAQSSTEEAVRPGFGEFAGGGVRTVPPTATQAQSRMAFTGTSQKLGRGDSSSGVNGEQDEPLKQLRLRGVKGSTGSLRMAPNAAPPDPVSTGEFPATKVYRQADFTKTTEEKVVDSEALTDQLEGAADSAGADNDDDRSFAAGRFLYNKIKKQEVASGNCGGTSGAD